MLFFTQCFGAVLDLIHLRFQHNKAKRVFSAAGQLVCVVNPTHNLKVSGWLPFDVPAARVQVLPPGWGGGGGGVASGTLPRSPGAPGKGHPSATQDGAGYPSPCWVRSPSPGVWMLSRRCGLFPCLAGATRVSVYFFPPRCQPRSRQWGWGGVRSEGVEGSKGRPPPSPKYLWASV